MNVPSAPERSKAKSPATRRLPGRTTRDDYHLVIGKVVAVHIDDDALTPDGRLDVLKVRPIARLGYKDYSSIDAVFEMERPIR